MDGDREGRRNTPPGPRRSRLSTTLEHQGGANPWCPRDVSPIYMPDALAPRLPKAFEGIWDRPPFAVVFRPGVEKEEWFRGTLGRIVLMSTAARGPGQRARAVNLEKKNPREAGAGGCSTGTAKRLKAAPAALDPPSGHHGRYLSGPASGTVISALEWGVPAASDP